MCATNQDKCFYSHNYSIKLNLNISGRISGSLSPFLGFEDIKFPFAGCYAEQDGLLKFTFYIDWFVGEKKDCGFTCFTGNFVNNNILLIDWMFVDNNHNAEFPVVGSDCLLSAEYFDGKMAVEQVKPFPVDLEILMSMN